jgi:hypothetical protein
MLSNCLNKSLLDVLERINCLVSLHYILRMSYDMDDIGTPRSTVLVLLCLYSLPRERLYRAAA